MPFVALGQMGCREGGTGGAAAWLLQVPLLPLQAGTRHSPFLREKNPALRLSSSPPFSFVFFPSSDLISCPCGPEPRQGCQENGKMLRWVCSAPV